MPAKKGSERGCKKGRERGKDKKQYIFFLSGIFRDKTKADK